MAINNGVHRVRERKASKFERFVPQYFLNKDGLLEESPIMRDTQSIVDSSEYTRLDSIYDRYIEAYYANNVYTEGEEIVREREALEDDLSRMLELDAIRDKYALENPDVVGMSHKEIKAYLDIKVKEANHKIAEHKEKFKEEKPDAPKDKKESE